jgi:UDP-glucose 4-epimerase
MKTVVVIGGCGFVGSNLVQYLINKNYTVIVIDNEYSGVRKFKQVLYIRDKSININSILKKLNIHTVFHFGEFSRINQSFYKTEDCLDFNIKGTLEVVKYCNKNNVKLVYSASSSTFNNKENLSPYAYSKFHNVNLIKNYHQWFNLKYEIVYFFNVYGPGQIGTGNMATVVGIFEDQYRNKKPLTVVKPGTQRRNFTHIDDIVNGIYKAWKKNLNKEYMLGNEKSYSVIEVAKMFNHKIKFIKEQKGERFKSVKIDNKNNKLLNFKAEINLKDYIKTLEHKENIIV